MPPTNASPTNATPAFDPNAGYAPAVSASSTATPAFDPNAGYAPANIASSATEAAPTSSSSGGVLDAAGNFIKGAAEGAVGSMADTISNLPWVGKKILSPEAMQAEREYFKPGSAAEKYGQTTGDIAEPVLEFVLGDEALKGVALADKLGIASKIADITQKSPYIGKLLQHGVNVARMGTVGTTEALAKGATLPEAIKTGAETGLGGEAVSAAAEAAPVESVMTRLTNPFRKAAIANAEAATSKIEPAVETRAAKAGLPPGEAGLSPTDARAQTAQAKTVAQTATQANVDKTIQDVATQHATANNIPVPAAGTATRDLLTANGDALVEAGKANYKILDKYTNGQFTNAQNELKNAQLELRAQAGTTGTDTSTLEANVTRAQWKVDQLFDDAVKNGMPKDTADLARTQFRTGQATLDAGNAVRMANRARGVAGLRTTDLNALENRWTALSDSGRLQQAFGTQGAQDALTQIHAARETAEVFNSMPPTESKALQDLIRKNTTTGKFGTTTDWKNVRDEFSQMNDLGARFSDIPKVENFINNQAFYQKLRSTAKWGAGLVLGGGLTAEGWNLAH